MKTFFLSFSLLLISVFTFAEGTRSWTQDTYEEFSRGTTQNVSIASTGALELAPALQNVYNTPSTFLWSMAPAKDGAVFVAGGSPARVYRVERDGVAQAIFEPKELQVQSLTVVGDTLYAATSPDGKIYKLTATKGAGTTPSYQATEFFDPKTKYIWQILAADDGTLYVATGDQGQIFRVMPDGKGTVYFNSDEAHIRALAFDREGNLIAGTDGSGLIYRITKQGEAFVLYSAPKKEITAITVAADGTIYVAGAGEKRPKPAPQPPNAPQPNQAAALVPFAKASGAEIYAIAPDGAPARIWSSNDDLVYALGFDGQGHLLAGTGNEGRILMVQPNGDYSDVAKASANQVIAFATTSAGTFAATSNLGKVFLLSSQASEQGTFESEVLDAKVFSKWGRAAVRGAGNYELAVRSGNVDNPDRNWSPWKTVQLGKDAKLEVPASRFLQWRVTLKPATGGSRVNAVTLYYLPKNVAPVIDDIAVAGSARLSPTAPNRGNNSDTVVINFNEPKPAAGPKRGPNEGSLNAQRERGYNTVRWASHDDNDDDLAYALYYRGENESSWKLLKSGITDEYYSFDGGLMPDGVYFFRVIASDAPSHTPEEALTSNKESGAFAVDNSAPQIESLAAKAENGQLHVSFSATDAMSIISRAEISVDAGDWKYIEPVGQLSDAKVETYDFNLAVPASPAPKATGKKKKSQDADSEEMAVSGEHVVVVRVYDQFDNSAVAKAIAK